MPITASLQSEGEDLVVRQVAAFGIIGLAASAALACMASSSLAGDAAAAPAAPSWTEVYIGLNGSWNFLSTSVSIPAQTYGADEFASASYGSQSGNGIGGGIQLGFDYQIDRLVLGIQGISSVTSFDSSITTRSGDKLGTELTSFGSLNARAGVLLQPELLVYGKGGLAFGSFKYTDKNAAEGYSGSADNERHQGWMLGGGVEYMFAPNWSAFAEYDYSFFGEQTVELSYDNAAWGDSFKYKYDQDIGSAVIGVNYRF